MQQQKRSKEIKDAVEEFAPLVKQGIAGEGASIASNAVSKAANAAGKAVDVGKDIT